MGPLNLLAVIALNLFFSTAGDICAKLWGTTGSSVWLGIGLVVNLATTFFFMAAIKLGSLSDTTALVLLATILINTALGVLVFREHLGTLQWIGVAIGLLAIGLLLPGTH